MGETAADGPSVADRGMCDMGDRFRQQWRVRRDFRRLQEIGMTGQRTDGEDVAAHRDATQFGNFADIDDQFGRDQPQIHRGHQALAARKHFRPVPMRFEQIQCVCNTGCACVSESRGFH